MLTVPFSILYYIADCGGFSSCRIRSILCVKNNLGRCSFDTKRKKLKKETAEEIESVLHHSRAVHSFGSGRFTLVGKISSKDRQRRVNSKNGADTDVIKAFSGDTLVMSKTMGDWRTHNGTDYAGNIGDPVRAVNNGRVTRVYDDVLWGTTVEIDHLDGLTVRYCGLGKGSTVSEGDEVKINDKIGNLSEIPAESADGTHFHIEAEKDGKYIDFESLLLA